MTARESLIYAIYPEMAGPGADEMLDEYRAEVLAEADARLATMTMPDELQHTLNAGTYRHAWRDCRATVKELAAGEGTREGESTPGASCPGFEPGDLCTRCGDARRWHQPAEQATPAEPTRQIWQVFEEDTPLVGAQADLYATQAAAELRTIARYEAMEGSCPDYSWPLHDDGSRELVAGGEPVGIYLTPVQVHSEPASVPVPDFFQPDHTYAHAHYRFQCLHLVTHPVTSAVQAWGWFGKDSADGRRHMSFGRGQWEARTWDDITEGEVPRG